MFSKVRGYLWIDEDAAQLARAELEVTDDISIGGFLAKVYKGSHLVQERYEISPGLWFPTYSQYDFDGRVYSSASGFTNTPRTPNTPHRTSQGSAAKPSVRN